MASNPDDYVERVVCNDSDIKENEMKVFQLEHANDVLLVRQDSVLYAVGSRCTHYDAPMVKGALGKGCIRCPWHGARFNLKSGDIEDFPGLDSLPTFKVDVSPNGEVKVRAKKSELESSRKMKLTAKENPCNRSVFVIIGGGPSAAVCAETLRQNGYTGQVIMIAEENALPYDRVIVSKALEAPIFDILLRSQEFYDSKNIQVKTGVKAVKVDPSCKTVSLSNGEMLEYSALYIATGSRPRILDIANKHLKNIFTLRTFTDSAALNNALGPDKHLVILGSSFIGMEAGSCCAGKVKSITIIGRDDYPLEKLVGREIGESFQRLFEKNGIQFRMKNKIKSYIEKNGSINGVKLSDNSTLPADILVLGIGSEFNTDFLKGSGIDIDASGSIPVNHQLMTNIKGIYAGGDIAKAPIYSHGGVAGAIGHFGLSQYHGKIAALNMANKPTRLKAVPFFWTRPFDHGIIYCGYGKYNDIKIFGNVPELKFVAYFLDGSEKVIAMASCQWETSIVSKFGEYLAQGKSLYLRDLKDDPFKWVDKVLQ